MNIPILLDYNLIPPGDEFPILLNNFDIQQDSPRRRSRSRKQKQKLPSCKKILKIRPQNILNKKITQSIRSKAPLNPVKYLVRWQDDTLLPKEFQGERLVGIGCLKNFLDMVEKYELANYDGPMEENIVHNRKPVDERIKPLQITCDLDQLQLILEMRNNNMVDLTCEEIPQRSSINIHLSTNRDKTARRIVSQEVVQGSFAYNDKADTLLNLHKNVGNQKYYFLITWAKRQDGVQPNPSWVSQDDLRINQILFLQKIIVEKNIYVDGM